MLQRSHSWRSIQTTLKEINPEYSLEGLMLKLQYFGHLKQRANSLENTLMLEKIEGKRRRGWQSMRWLGWHHWVNEHEFEQTLGDSGGQGSLVFCSPWGHRVRHSLGTEQQHSCLGIMCTWILQSAIFLLPLGIAVNTKCFMSVVSKLRHSGILQRKSENFFFL